jgi:tetratricopeptide (TPR) repeat protein
MMGKQETGDRQPATGNWQRTATSLRPLPVGRGRLPVAGLLFLATACASTSKPPTAAKPLPTVRTEAKASFEEGVRLLNSPDGLTEARGRFVAAVKADENLYEGWHDLGVVEARLGHWGAAAEAFQRALALQPAARTTVIALGEVWGRAGRWADAAALYGERLASGEDPDLRLRRVQALREAGKTTEALDEVRALLAKDSKNAAAFNALGLVYYRMDRLPLAESAFRRAIELDPKSKTTAPVWNNLGLVALGRGRDQEAFAAFAQAAELDRGHREAHVNQALVYLDCGDYARAERELRRSLEIDPDDPDGLVALGVALRGLKRFDEARAAYERALVLRPEHPPALYDLGVLYMDFQQDKAKARENLTRYRKLASPTDPKRPDAAARLRELR